MMNKKKEFEKICKDIKNIKIQGATNIAKAALKAYSLIKTKSSKSKLLSLRPTEPMLSHVLDLADKIDNREILSHFSYAQERINENVRKLLKNNSIIYTHCHSTNVVRALIYSKSSKKFRVYNTETRPLFQGRKTANELSKSHINVTLFIDSAIKLALLGSVENRFKKVNYVFLGADAILKDGIINKIGSGMISEIAYNNKIPVYIIADSWKFSNKPLELEKRDSNEIWINKKINIENPAFEFIDKRFITGIISEFGLIKYDDFLKKVV